MGDSHAVGRDVDHGPEQVFGRLTLACGYCEVHRWQVRSRRTPAGDQDTDGQGPQDHRDPPTAAAAGFVVVERRLGGQGGRCEGSRELVRGLESVRGCASEGPADGLGQGVGNGFADRRDVRCRVGELAGQNGSRGACRKRGLTSEHLVQDAGEGVHVGAAIDRGRSAAACSGLMYCGVPIDNPVAVSRSPAAAEMATAIPKSAISG